MSESTRRSLLAAVSAVTIGSGITAGAAASVADFVPSSPDADLLAACADYLRIQRAFDAIVVAGDVENDDPRLSMLDPLPALVERIVKLKATTAEGHVARARCMTCHYLAHHPIAQDDPDGAAEDRFQAALYRDLIAQERAGRA